MAVYIKGDPVANATSYSLYEKAQTNTSDNLIINTGKSTTINGLAFVVNADGSVTVRGSSATLDDSTFVVCDLEAFDFEAATYYLSGCPGSFYGGIAELSLEYESSDGSARLLVDNSSDGTAVKSTSISTAYQSGTFRVTITVNVGSSVGDIELTFKPMLSTKADAEFTDALGGITYNKLDTASFINFDLASLNLGAGNHTLVVQATADGYADSDYSNEVVYSQS